MQNIAVKSLVVITGMTIVMGSSVAKANDPGLCFIKTASGKIRDLGQLCAKQVESPDVIVVPIKRRLARTPIIDVMFNGKYVSEMVLDTGASGILITQELATALNLKPTGQMKGHLADGSIVTFDTSKITSVAVGSLVVDAPTVAIAPKATIGLLGHGFFQDYDVEVLDKFVEFRKR